MSIDNRGQGEGERKIENDPKRPFENWSAGDTKKKVTPIVNSGTDSSGQNKWATTDAFCLNASLDPTHSVSVQESFLRELHHGLEEMCHNLQLFRTVLDNNINMGVIGTTLEVKNRLTRSYTEIDAAASALKQKIEATDIPKTLEMIKDHLLKPE